jgi:hypothetical protein
MDIALQVAIVSAVVTLCGALLVAIVNYYRERSERERAKTTLELEKRRLQLEAVKWALELNNQREVELHRMRLQTYPEVFTGLASLSHHEVPPITKEQALVLADKLNVWGYGAAGLCMLPDTRDAMFVVRDRLVKFSCGEIGVEELLGGPRTDLIELMRRDCNHDWSRHRQFRTLTEVNEDRVKSITASVT